ncbi:MAG: flagellar biosynthesis protein FlhA [Myxococcales bacterium]
MSDDEEDPKTEPPSPRKIKQAWEEGQIPVSRDVIGVASVAAGVGALFLVGPSFVDSLIGIFGSSLRGLSQGGAPLEAAPFARPLLLGLASCAAAALAAAGAAVAQTQGYLWPHLALPDFSRLAQGTRLKKLFSKEALADLGLSFAKVLALSVVLWRSARVELTSLPNLVGATPGALLTGVFAPLARCTGAVLVTLGLLAGLDLAVARYRFNQKMKTTREEAKREHKEDEGDPMLRARRRRRHRELAKGRPAVEVPRADALVVNPTHIAIAIRYRRDEDKAPRVTAKGKGVLAEKMRELARENGVPIVQDIPLARLLYKRVKVGREVPAQTYKAVAAVLAFVYRITGKSFRSPGMSASDPATGAPGPGKGVTAQTALAFAVLGVLSILILPVPPLIVDLLLALSIGLSVLMLLVALGLKRPLDFSVFPSLLLIATLFRLGLSVATTRLILLNGSGGTAAAGHVIEAFGRFMVGGSLVVGAVVFLILLVVNFAVITKGSGRISEVAARFTLDALPGKQMSIDADLAAGLLDDKEARARRSLLEHEVEFFGAMDGASKFVRGDAIAGLAITGINLVGGLIAGLLRDHLSLAQAASTYTLLTVGDGLVTQMPALLISTAAGMVVTRAAGDDLGTQVQGQIFGSSKVLASTSLVLGAMALIPGLPALAFGPLALGTYLLSRRAKAAEQKPASATPQPEAKKGERLQDLLQLDALALDLGFGLLPLIDSAKGGELPGRITALRRKLAEELGVVLPPVHLRDNLRLEPNEYRLSLRGVELARGKAWADRVMALDPSGQTPTVPGLSAKEPAFGLPAVWIIPADRPKAERAGLTLVDPASMVTTHLSELLRRNAHELVGRQEVQELLALTGKEAPKLVEDVVPAVLTLGALVQVVRGLLREGISVRDLRTVLESAADAAPKSKDPVFLVEQARRRLSRQITGRVSDGGVVKALTLDHPTEDLLRSTAGASDGELALAPDVETARRLIGAIEAKAASLAAEGRPAVLLAPPDLRKPLFDFASRFVPDLWVVSARELVPGTSVEPAGLVQVSHPSQGAAS